MELYKPDLKDLWFREKIMNDPDTMSYNNAWGGTIAFPESKWEDWYDYWIINHDNKRFFRYLKEGDTYAGEIAYHLDEKRNVWIADVIIPFEYRGKGYGTQGLGLLCEAAANNGIAILYDDIAIDNPGISLFLKVGFCEEYRTDEYIMLKKELSNKIQIEEILYENVGEFWDDHIKYLVTDGIISDKEDIDYYKGSHYRGILESHMKREPDKQHMVYFIQDGVRIGAASYCTYKSEDGKCFILDYWVFPEFRGNGTGHRCYEALEKYTRADGAKYYELNSEKDASVRFWKSLGFIPNGVDEYDMPLFIKKDDGRKIPDSADDKRIISIVDDSKRKQKISRCILEELPEWFGIQESREKYIEDSANRVMVASFDGDKPTGFLCLKETGKATVEVAVMGVLKEYHRMGIGKMLFEKAREIAIEQGYSFIQVKTVQMGRYKEYDDTNQFYQSLGFKEMEVFPTLWDEWNPCQVYIMAIS